MKGGRIEQLDGLRGIAVLWVILFHYSSCLPTFPIVSQIAARGWAGVDLFFVLSGFLIGGIVLANQESARFFFVFYTRRLLRIFPLYYLLLAVTSLAVWAGWMHHPHGGLLLAAVYGQNLATAFTHDYGLSWLQPTWSLAVEEHFYLVLPALVFFVPARYLKRTLLGGILLATAMRVFGYLLPVPYPRDFARFFTLCRIDALFYGVLLAFLLRGRSLTKSLPAWYAGMLVGSAAFAAVCHFDHKFPNEVVMTTVGLSLLGPLFVCVVAVALAHENGFIALMTKLRPLPWIGVRSYAIYLFHMPTLDGARALLASYRFSNRYAPALALVLTLALAAVSWRFIEAPLIAIGHRRNYRERTVHNLSNFVTEQSQKAHAT